MTNGTKIERATATLVRVNGRGIGMSTAADLRAGIAALRAEGDTAAARWLNSKGQEYYGARWVA